jgi:ubiquinone biosynthesis protein UbiJ
MLNELEKAHIYIEQLNDTIKQLQQRLEQLESETAE